MYNEQEAMLDVIRERVKEEKENLKKHDEEIKPILDEIEKINNSFWMKIHRSVLWFVFPWTSIIKKQKMKEIEKIKNDNKEKLEAREFAYRRVLAAMKVELDYKAEMGK